MIAYRKTWIWNNALLKKAKQWYAQHLLSDEQYSAAILKYPNNFYNPSLFIKIGLFLFTWLAIGASLGLYALFFSRAFDWEGMPFFTSILFAVGSIFTLEFFIKNNNLYHSGTDQALLYAALIAIALAVADVLHYNIDTPNAALAFSVFLAPFLIAAVLRYSDKFVALVLAIFCYAIFFLLVLKVGAFAKLVMPFALMALSAIIYFKTKKMKHGNPFFYWEGCIIVFECVALLAFYISGNYFVIRESSIAFFDLKLKPHQDIPLAFFFYFFTVFVPLAYVFFGLKNKNKILLWIGLVLVAVAVITFKYYFSLGHPEFTLTVVGMIMVLIAYAAIKFLKTPKHGITFEEEMDEDNFLKTNTEALLVAQSFHPTGQQYAEQAPEFGGGASGGSGAGGGF